MIFAPTEMGARLENWINKNVWDFSKKSITPVYDLKGTDARSMLLGYNDNFSNEIVTEKRAHGLATVYTCINVRARTIASLPLNVIRESKDGKKQILTDHPAYWLLAHEPNKYMSAANLFLTSMIHSDSWGNSIIGINRDSYTGAPTSLELVCPGDWSYSTTNGELWYKINGEVYSPRDVLHFRWFSYDGICGVSPIRLNAITMGKKIKEDKFSSMAIGQKPPGILSYEGELSDTQRAQNKDSWQKDLQLGNTPILSGRWKFEPIMFNPADAEYINASRLTDQDIYGIFQLPPAFAQNYERMTWNNAEQTDVIFTKHTITPIARVIEKECDKKLFTEREKKNTYTRFNLNGLLRGDSKSRAEFYTAMRNIGGMNGNEIREREDLNSYEGGEIFTVQGANVPVDQLRSFYESKVAPTAPPTQEPNRKLNGQHYEFTN